MSDMMKTLGENVIRVRNEKGMSGNDLAARLGIAMSELDAIEKGTTDADMGLVYRMVEALGVGLEDIICSERTKNELVERIKNKLNTCSEKDLVLVFEYISSILMK